MYLLTIVLLLLVLPLAAVVIEAPLLPGADLMALVGKWFTFFAVGARLFLAGVRQTLKPEFTARKIFATSDAAAHFLVREIGFGNLSMGTLGLLSLLAPGWVLPAAIVGGLYYGLAGVGHVIRGEKTSHGQIAMVSDLMIFVLLAAFVAIRVL